MSDPTVLSVIDLAHTADFPLGALTVSPSAREVIRREVRESLEPRVMQVLVALAQAKGAVVSRDDLIARCWDGRVVGDDAINRAIGRLRRLSETSGAFRIETIPRIGYRLLAETGQASPPLTISAAPARPDRRWLLAGGAIAAVATAGAGAWIWSQHTPTPAPAAPPDVMRELAAAKQLLRQGMVDTGAQGVRMLERIVAAHPDVARGWGALATVYVGMAYNKRSKSEAMRLRAEAALRRARALDPHEQTIYLAEAYKFPNSGHWGDREQLLREGLRFNPRADELLMALGYTLFAVGRVNEAADTINRAIAAAGVLDPSLSWLQIATLDAAGRLQEADQAAANGIAMFPRHTYVWFSRLYLFMFSGRLQEAKAMLDDADSHPLAVPVSEFEQIGQVVTALDSKARSDIDKAIAVNIPGAHAGAGLAENLIGYASALGRLDFAFEVANGLLFNRGFPVGELRFTAEQGVYTPLLDRRTEFLFRTPAAALRKDSRFDALAREIGLEAYWRKAGVQPDFRREG